MTSSTGGARRNRLAHETSPYLLQHAGNPVDWLPWSDEALTLARSTGKPILLSIGYSACHWCHVMAHESFEDEPTATVMNRHFFNIMVDREERPDLDRIYQLAHQLLTQRPGGWPLTMFLTPDDHTPFFGGTYFPPVPRYGMPAFKDLLLRIVDFLASHPDEIVRQGAALRDALARAEAGVARGPAVLTEAPLAATRERLERTFDATHGGFGRAPKFPHPTGIERLMRHYVASALRGDPDRGALHIVRHSLEGMARGGVFDHVGGGFFRYAVDDGWMIPHFEKMLYDNAALLATYATAAGITREPLFADVAHRIGDWVMREMQAPEGGYFSSLDADSDAEEGKFYVWSPDEVRAVLDGDEHAVVSAVFGLDRPPNFEGRHWHLHTFELPRRIARRQGRGEAATAALLASSMAKLHAAREPRRHPGRDEKVLVSWNALMISAMTHAARRLDREDFAASAERARDFVRARLWREGRLLATAKDGQARLMAYLDDYAFLVEALLNLLSVRWRREDLDWCVALADVILERFEDRDAGGFFFTANDHERLIHRSKSFMDDALPAGNAVACAGLLRLGHLLGEMRYIDAAERALRCAWPALTQAPHAHNAMLNALEDYLSPPQSVVIRGSGDAARRWLARAGQGTAPRRHALLIPSEAGSLPGLLAARRPIGEVTAYVCTGHRCDGPTDRFESYAATLARDEPLAP